MATGSGSLQAQNSTATGVSERQIDVTGALSAQASAVTGVSENTISGSGAIVSQVSSVSGVSENTITGSGTLEAQDPTISITANRSYTISADLNDGDVNIVGGQAERDIRQLLPPGSGDFRPTVSNLVTGEAERIVTSSSSISLESSTVNGVADNIINGSGAISDSSSIVVAVSERKTTASGTTSTGSSTVVGASERIITEVEADLTADEVGVVAVTGDSERIITGSGALQTESTVSATTKVTTFGSGTLHPTTNNVVAGVSEREITGTGALDGLSDHVVAGVAERIIASTVSLTTGTSSVTGVAENIIVGSGALDTITNFTVNGFSERNVTGSGAPQAQASTVSGVAENEVVAESGQLVIGLSTVTATVEIGATSSGTLAAQTSTVSGLSEREVTGSGTLVDASSSVSGISERGSIGSGTLSDSSSSVDGLAEREITGTGVLVDGVSSVAGVSERVITASGTLDTGTSTVVGVAERQVDVTGAMETGASTVSGVSERTVNASGTLTTGSSTVTGLAENIVNASGTLQDSVSTVDGLAERIIVGSGTLVTGTSTVTGVAERGVDADNIAIELLNNSSNVTAVANIGRLTSPELDTTPSLVVGVAERQIDLDAGITQVDASVVAGIAERQIDVTGSMETGTSVVSGVAEVVKVASGINMPDDASDVSGVAEREIVLISGIGTSSADQYGPSTNIYLSYSGENLVVDLPGTSFDGTYTPTNANFKVTWVGGGYEYVSDSEYRVWQKQNSGSDYDILIWNTTFEQWHIFEESTSVESASAGDSLSDGSTTVISEGSITIAGSVGGTTTDSLVAGIAERIVTVDAGIEQVDASVVAGVSEREITGQGDLVVPDVSKVVGVAEREINVTGINMPDDDSKVDGLAERTISKPFFADPLQGPDNIVNGIAEREIPTSTGAPHSDLSTVVGVAERTINLFSGIEQVDPSIVAGIAERTINGQGDLVVTDPSKVSGVAERIINTFSGIDMPDDDSKVSGVAERIVVLEEGIDMPDDDSKVVGLSERTINTFSGIEQVDPSVVSGIAERIINTFSGILMPDDDSKVVGVAEREVENNEITQALKPTDNNLVTGVAERIINLFESPRAGHSHMGQDEVITIDRHPIGGTEYPEYRSDLYAGDAQPTLDADRVHTQETDGLSTKLKYGPNSSDPNVVYINSKYLRLAGNADPLNDGVYDLLDAGFTCAVSSGNNLTLATNKNYNVYYRKVGYQDYRVCMFRTTNLTWVAFQTTLNPELFFSHGTVIINGQLNGELIASTSQSRGGPYKIMKPTDYNVVAGLAERNVEDNTSTHELIAEESFVTGFGTRKVKPLDGALHAQPSVVAGIAERELDDQNREDMEVNADPSTVSGIGARHANGSGVLVSGPSTMGGLAENQIDGEAGIAQVDDASVTGLAERTVVNIPDYDIVVEGSGSTEEFTVYYPQAKISGPLEISYDGNDIVLSGTNNDGTYVFTGQTYQVATSTYRYTNNVDYMVFEKDNGNGTYDIIAATSGTQRWTVFIGTTTSVLDADPLDDVGHSSEFGLWTDSTQRTVTHGIPDTVTPTSKVEAGSSEIVGTGAVTRKAFGALQASEDHVMMTAKRTVVSLDATIQSSSSQVLATDDRISVGVPGKCDPKAQDATVTATVERTSNGVEVTPASDPSIVDGIGFRTSKGSGVLDTEDHIVEGEAERVITAVGVLEAEDCSVTGEAHKIIHVVQGIAQVSSSVVHGVSERTITTSADLVCTDSKVEALVYTNNIEQQSMHVQMKFRIRKESVRRIIVRQTPTNRV